MKKFIVRLSLLCVLISMSFNSVDAQHRSRPYHRQHYHGGGDGIYRAIRTAESIGHAAMFGRFLHGLDDYTGLRIGYNAASLRTDMEGLDINSEYNPGFNIGVVFGWHLGPTPLILEPGIYYSMKGGKLKGSYLNYDNLKDLGRFTTDITMHSIEIPLVLKCQLPLAPDNSINLQPFFGGFLSFGFAGTTKYKDAVYHDSYDTYGDDLFGSTDAGLRMGTGLSVGQFYMEFAYDLGLVNLPNSGYDLMGYDDYCDSTKSNTLSFSVGFNF